VFWRQRLIFLENSGRLLDIPTGHIRLALAAAHKKLSSCNIFFPSPGLLLPPPLSTSISPLLESPLSLSAALSYTAPIPTNSSRGLHLRATPIELPPHFASSHPTLAPSSPPPEEASRRRRPHASRFCLLLPRTGCLSSAFY
jgi:hypothetical protein